MSQDRELDELRKVARKGGAVRYAGQQIGLSSRIIRRLETDKGDDFSGDDMQEIYNRLRRHLTTDEIIARCNEILGE